MCLFLLGEELNGVLILKEMWRNDATLSQHEKFLVLALVIDHPGIYLHELAVNYWKRWVQMLASPPIVGFYKSADLLAQKSRL